VGPAPALVEREQERLAGASAEALELTLLIARKEPHRHQRVAARWLLRYLEECPRATIEEAAMAAACLIALGTDAAKNRPRPFGTWPKERLVAGTPET
jgi:hypothetical protein